MSVGGLLEFLFIAIQSWMVKGILVDMAVAKLFMVVYFVCMLWYNGT